QLSIIIRSSDYLAIWLELIRGIALQAWGIA
ncbi:MAG: hypothetical protein ACI945_001670, partial [Pseudohongiellaceae bacterium]